MSISKMGFAASFCGGNNICKSILEEMKIKEPKGFFDLKDFHEMFMVVEEPEVEHKVDCLLYSDDKENCNCPTLVGIWFADISEDMFFDLEGNLVDKNPDVFYVDLEDVILWA